MRPEEMGFVLPCERCSGPLWKALVKHCRSYSAYEIEEWGLLDWSSAEKAHGDLERIRGAGAVGCRVCGARWVVVDVEPQFRTVDIRQESADGRYYSSGRYEQGKRHGPFGYYTPLKIGWDLLFAEWWDHGRLVAWQEYGPVEVDAQGKRHLPLVRSWREAQGPR